MINLKFKAVYLTENTVSEEAYTIEELASYEEHEWQFNNGSSLPANDVEPGDLEYLLWTGHLDKKDKEIFNYDIVEMTFPAGMYGDSVQVFMPKTKVNYFISFAGAAAGFFACKFLNEPDEFPTFLNGIYFEEMKIIGNKFENPELIEQ